MKKKLLFGIAILPLLFLLPSCTVNWGTEQYQVSGYILVPLLIIFSAILFIISTRLIVSYPFRCTKCGKTFYPQWQQAILSIHIGSARLFRCPHCGHRGFFPPSHDKT